VIIAPGKSQDWSWTARGREVMSLFVYSLNVSKAPLKIVSEYVEGMAVDGTWDMVWAEEAYYVRITSKITRLR
jgi:hypothetical protein